MEGAVIIHLELFFLDWLLAKHVDPSPGMRDLLSLDLADVLFCISTVEQHRIAWTLELLTAGD